MRLFLLFVVIMIMAILALASRGNSQEPVVIIPSGRTAQTIKPFYVHKVKVEAHVNKPKKKGYCPLENADYQCPMPKEHSNLKEGKDEK